MSPLLRERSAAIPVIVITPRNVVCGGSVGVPVTLERLASVGGAQYAPEIFPFCKLRLNGCTVMVFRSGRVVVVGATSEEMAFGAFGELVRVMREADIPLGDVHQTIHNVVATANLGRRFDLAGVVQAVSRSMYEPERFPGVVLRRLDPKCTILLFASGRLVCAGADSVGAASAAVNRLHADLAAVGV